MEERQRVRYGKAQSSLSPPGSSLASSFWVFGGFPPTLPPPKKKHHWTLAIYSPLSPLLPLRSGGWDCKLKPSNHMAKNAFKLWYWRIPRTARRLNHSMLKEINPEYSLEGQMLKLNLQYFGHLMWRADSLEKTLMLGEIKGRRKGR